MVKIKSKLFLGLFMVVWVCLAADKPKLVKTKVNDAITVLVPQDWQPMDGMDFNERYPSVRAPLAAYTDHERLADFSVNISATQWPDKDLELAQKFFKSSLMNLFDKVDMISEGVRETGNKKVIYFEFNSRMNGNKRQEGFSDPVLRYSYVQYLLGAQRTVVFSFSCPRRLQPEWQETAGAMMMGIKVK